MSNLIIYTVGTVTLIIGVFAAIIGAIMISSEKGENK